MVPTSHAGAHAHTQLSFLYVNTDYRTQTQSNTCMQTIGEFHNIERDSSKHIPRWSIFRWECWEAPDQLRQRVAWALAQIFVVAPDDATMSHTEMQLGQSSCWNFRCISAYVCILCAVNLLISPTILLDFSWAKTRGVGSCESSTQTVPEVCNS